MRPSHPAKPDAGTPDTTSALKQDAMQLGITPQDRGKEQTMAAAGIGDALDAREIVSFDDGFGGPGGRIRHRSLEDLALLGALRQDLPDILAKSQGHAIAAATQTFRDVLIGQRGE